MNNKSVNGPINIVRLEGKIGRINKVIYILMDFHLSVGQQTECDDIRSTDIDKFLVNVFDKVYETNKDKTYDLFVELNPLYDIVFGKSPNKGRYLFEQTKKLFSQSININSGKVYQSDKLKNVRFHYADIREYTTRRYDFIMAAISEKVDIIWNTRSIQYDDIIKLLDGMKLIYAQVTFLYELMYNNKEITKPKTPMIFTDNQLILSNYTDKNYQDIAKKLLYKILKKYKHLDVKNVINRLMSTEVHDKFKKLFGQFNDMVDYLHGILIKLEPYKNTNIYRTLRKMDDGTYMYGLDSKELYDIICNINKLPTLLWDLLVGEVGLQLMDLYVMRRILDKDYITNAVVYTGAHHSVNYIRMLVKYFNFNITHSSYLKDNDINKATNIIKNSNSCDELNELFYPSTLKQCSSLEGFPGIFE
jgi:hypothetical protein